MRFRCQDEGSGTDRERRLMASNSLVLKSTIFPEWCVLLAVQISQAAHADRSLSQVLGANPALGPVPRSAAHSLHSG